MPRKPTTPFGYVSFGKDGTVRPHIEKLSDEKFEQERSVAHRFVAQLNEPNIPAEKVRMLDESNHDFLVQDHTGLTIATCQATEIVLRDYCTPLTNDQYMNGKFANVISDGNGKYQSISRDLQNDLIRKKIELKLEKHYARPSHCEFWLLIWSVSGHPIGSYHQSGRLVISCPIRVAQKWLSLRTNVLFDRIYLYELNVRPELVWPQATQQS